MCPPTSLHKSCRKSRSNATGIRRYVRSPVEGVAAVPEWSRIGHRTVLRSIGQPQDGRVVAAGGEDEAAVGGEGDSGDLAAVAAQGEQLFSSQFFCGGNGLGCIGNIRKYIRGCDADY